MAASAASSVVSSVYTPDELKKQMKTHNKMLMRGKAKPIGIIERLIVRLYGKADGQHELIRQKEDTWSSAFINQEHNSLGEHCDKVWGQLQITNAGLLYRLGTLVEKLQEYKIEYEDIDNELAHAEQNGLELGAVRKRGEENLPESQIKARRARELVKTLSPLKAKKAGMEEQIRKAFDEAVEIRNLIIENANAARHVCDRITNHTRQRIDTYWRAAMTTHPKSADMPAYIEFEFDSEAEKTYFDHHNELIKEADKELSETEQNILKKKEDE